MSKPKAGDIVKIIDLDWDNPESKDLTVGKYYQIIECKLNLYTTIFDDVKEPHIVDHYEYEIVNNPATIALFSKDKNV